MTRLHAVPGTNSRVAVDNVVVPGETVEMKLARAKGYPYPRPNTSFLFINSDTAGGEGQGEVFLFDNEQWRGQQHMPHIRGRCGTQAADFAVARGVDLSRLAGQKMWPVLAIGSNAGPEQLRRKYPAADFPGAVIAVIQIQLHGFDVVYTPYLASYGSCTATLEASPGTCVSIFITYLTEPLMERMHATEGGYNLTRLGGLHVEVAPHGGGGKSSSSNGGSSSGDGTSKGVSSSNGQSGKHAASGGKAGAFEVVDTVYQYNHKLGCINLPLRLPGSSQEQRQQQDGGAECSPVAIAEIPAVGRAFPAATQPQMLAALREALGGSVNSSNNDNGNGQGEGEGGDGDVTAPLQPIDLDAVGMPEAQAGLDQWILRMVGDQGLRQAVCERLAGHARPFTHSQSELMVTL
ncbi:hypothetical protein CHLRE_04g215550v5 [Chlamydomonas reinhardtii]|uniref:Uncharacterized protein n=1 Tax=Chlamydomonas reinhardtii TaxID=3055 RepID=A0A2K3DTQ0_CHLRE|nr:uncharacterized protein CHLRE_04g215550v5 [Chlamydomonas reinhardtii]PNW83919.1 hypothetical protein CHLRE_04g215550v5 [Chlamydomonas reinhardtii]